MQRRPFSTQDAYASGATHAYLRNAVRRNRLQRVVRGVYIEGSDPPTSLEYALGLLVATNGVASGTLAGALHKVDSMKPIEPFVTIPSHRSTELSGVRRADIPSERIMQVNGYPCTDGLQTMIDLADIVDDLRYEQALESALFKELLSLDDLQNVNGVRGAERIRRVLALRPPGAPPTESLLETLMVQLIRTEPRLPTPERQVVVLNKWNRFVARVDLSWPAHGIFLELDGQQHKDQPEYDAVRQTNVVAAKGWLPGRFNWHEVNFMPLHTTGRLLELFEQRRATA